MFVKLKNSTFVVTSSKLTAAKGKHGTPCWKCRLYVRSMDLNKMTWFNFTVGLVCVDANHHKKTGEVRLSKYWLIKGFMCLLGDAIDWYYNETFEDFCSQMCYDPEDKHSLMQWRGCSGQWYKTQRIGIYSDKLYDFSHRLEHRLKALLRGDK